ncbi:MAG: hypothetical protein Q8R83_08395 [Legionellaceae bacterium]|nr:hypothetical protein [Legionellaceae bacterium]
MKRILLSILAIFFPWIVLLIAGQPIAAIANLALQLTVIGTIPAAIWGLIAVKKLCHPPENAPIVTLNDEDNSQQLPIPQPSQNLPKEKKET